MVESSKKVIFRDSTLREGLDVPGVSFSVGQKLRIAKLLEKVGVPEVEIVAPSRVLEDLKFVQKLKEEGSGLKTSGLIYSHKPDCRKEIKQSCEHLDRFDLLMPVSEKRGPYDRDTKISLLLDAVKYASDYHRDFGIGFPHSTQTDIEFLCEINERAIELGAKRVTVYDTNGSSDPFSVYEIIKKLKENLDTEIFFHGHNDLGLATANSLAAVEAGAGGLDVTVNGLGDRAGNCSLEQIAICLHLKGFDTVVRIESLRQLSKTVEEESGVPVSKLAPVVGDFIFSHKSPSHLENPGLFEAFDPRIVDSYRKINN